MRFTNFDELPQMLTAKDLAALLNIQLGGAYNLLRTPGFPTLSVGQRRMVSKDNLLQWIEANTAPTLSIHRRANA